MTETVINFRCDEDIASKAKGRFAGGAVKFPDLLRVAVSAIATGDTTVFNEILRETELGASGNVNSAWLYYTCHSLFIYRDGQLYAKRNKGSRSEGEPVELKQHAGKSCVIINGKFYPVREIIWLMFYGFVDGEVISVRGDSNRISDLEIEGGDVNNRIVFHEVSDSEREDILCYKQRNIIINAAEQTREVRGALERLYKSATVFYVRLYDNAGWRITRSAIHATMIHDMYVVSIS